MPMDLSEPPPAPQHKRLLRKFIRGCAATTVGACVLLGLAGEGFGAGPLGTAHGGTPVPNLAPSLAPGSSPIPAPGSGSNPEVGPILGPNLGVPSSVGPAVAPLDPLSLPNLGAGLPAATSPGLEDLPKNLRESLQPAGKQPEPIRKGFTLPAAGERRFLADEVVLDLPRLPLQTLDAIARRHHLTLVGSRGLALTGHMLYRWRIDDGRAVAEVIRALAGETRISAAQPNFTFSLQQAPPAANAGDSAQYAPAKLRLPEAHRLADGRDVPVAVIDSGIDAAHAELVGAVAGSYDAVAGGGEAGPDPHGTAVAGAIAAHGRLTGAAPRARLLAVRAFAAGPQRDGTTFSILAGLDWAVGQGARVVNMSFAGPADPALHEALAKARKKGVVLIAAAGNAGPKSPPLYPAADPNVIAVTATDAGDRLYAQANRGGYVALAAPGVDVLVPAPQGAMQLSTGTSIAAAHVSGVAALMLERTPALRPDQVRKILVSTARRLGAKPRDDEYGAGIADALDAVSALAPKAAAK
jgi:subtilisin family serine protease